MHIAIGGNGIALTIFLRRPVIFFNFAKLISKNSNVQVITVQNGKDLKRFFQKNLFDDELVLCMGAGSISKWIREMEL